MTIRETLTKYLVDNGLGPQEAELVIELVIDAYQNNETARKDMGRRLNDDTESYPPQFIPTLLLAIQHEAVEWIDTNKPLHFARLMFTEDSEVKPV